MDYEKAYKESFEAAKGLYEAGNALTKKQMEIVFPQLAESEDERIRKNIVSIINQYSRICAKEGDACDDINECLAWLEKQKKQKHPNGCFTCDEYKKGYEEGRRNGFTAGYNKAMKEVEQKEQKPVVTHGETYRVDTLGTQQVIAGKMPQKPAEWSEDIIRKAVKEIGLTQHQIDWFKDNVFPSKVEWSEEDEGELQNAIDALEFLGKKGVYKSESGYDAALQAASWLKSLHPQPKQEWSEEDEILRVRTINRLETLNFHGISGKEIRESIDWLKSLRPQPHWKPTEEQIGALNYAYCELFKRGDVGHNILGPLQKLCDELKNFSHEIH